ncbi:hypothetical protein CesoFtcFv8_010785 [Champsocephalus esox]|uniref:Uncharacterized protein n=1 Tax=Champsocephalus esox TaxID=159716 RepID=A0AAN8BZ45_9TELE|nr:hypothetical protein CesoFtcFv8_010785 [Champsocephalus esox]
MSASAFLLGGGGAGENSGKSTGGGRVQICGPAPRQHGVSGSPTPSASWETGGCSHPRWNVMFGTYAPWNVGEVTVEWDVPSAMLTVTGALSTFVVVFFVCWVLMQHGLLFYIGKL